MRLKNYRSMVLAVASVLLPSVPVYAQTAEEYLQNGNDSYRLNELDQAIVEYSRAIEIDPNFAKAYDNRGVVYAQEGSMDRAVADFTMAIANNPKDAEAYNNRGHAYFEKDNFPQAIYDYTKAIEMNTIYVKAYNNRKMAYYKLKEYDKAWADVHKVNELGGSVDPDFIEALSKASGRDH